MTPKACPALLKGGTLESDCLRTKNCSVPCQRCGKRDEMCHLTPLGLFCADCCPACNVVAGDLERWKLLCRCGHEFETAAGPKRDTVSCPSCGAACSIHGR